MKIKCDYCGNTYEDTKAICPFCDAPNPTQKGSSINSPKTIDGLKQWYEDRHLPPEYITRFFIGVNYKEPKAFGIYQDGDEFIVYKNKADGSRAIRYQGKDEAYAVNELFEKLKEEVIHQKLSSSGTKTSGMVKGDPAVAKAVMFLFSLLMFVVFMVSVFTNGFATNGFVYHSADNSHNGYYKYNNHTYYNYGGDWYVYNSLADDYIDVRRENAQVYEDETKIIKNNYDDYYVGGIWNSAISAENWEESDTGSAVISSSHSNSYGSGHSNYDWGSGDSWDSGGTDWDSDW